MNLDAGALILVTVIGAATPLLLAALGELVVEKSGVLNLGVEGMMLAGAVTAFATAITTGSSGLGVVTGALAGPLAADGRSGAMRFTEGAPDAASARPRNPPSTTTAADLRAARPRGECRPTRATSDGAEGGTRTPTPLRALDPESSASANSATSARKARS